MKRLNQYLFALAAVMLLLSPGVSRAQTNWSAVDDDWLVGGNWSGGLPAAGDTAQIGNNGTANIGGDVPATGNLAKINIGHVNLMTGTVVQTAGTVTTDNMDLA